MKNTNIIMQNKDIASVFVVTAAILMIPLLAMQFSTEVDWKLGDFVIMGTLIVSTGLLAVLANRKIKKVGHKVAVIAGLLVLLLLTWVHLAVGIIDHAPFAGS